jgi:glutaredoxin
MINLYTTGCSQCVILKKKLEAKNIKFKEITDIDIIHAVANHNNIRMLPILEVDGEILDYRSASEWVKGEK